MSATEELFHRANDVFRRRAYQQWQRGQRKQQILRSQVGFRETALARPPACSGCANYHGLAYGTQRRSRTILVCAIHPYGWTDTPTCPDWCQQS